MKNIKLVTSCLCVAILLNMTNVTFSQSNENLNILKIANQRQLFVDKYIIDSISGGAQLKMHEAVDKGSVLTFDRPWEGIFCGYSTVIKDGDKYKLFYRSSKKAALDYKGLAQEYTCYAESSDGINWIKPSLGLYEIDGSKDNNIVLKNETNRICHNFSPFLDTRPGVPACERYKGLGGTWKLAHSDEKRLWAYCSGDGIHWKPMQTEPVYREAGWALDSQNVAFWSEAEGRYVLFFRKAANGKRSVAKATSKDFIHWTKGQMMSYSDSKTTIPSCQLYTNQTHPYFRAPQIYFSTPARFFENRQVLTDAQAKEIGVDPKYFKDTSDAGFMTARPNSMIYDRTFMSALIRPGIGARQWVSRTNYPALNIVATSETEMSLYVNKDYAQPTAHLKRYAFRIDGITSAGAGYQGGELITKAFTFEGNCLSLNYATSAAGSIRIEIQDADGIPIPGFTLEESRELIGDEIDRAYDWNGSKDVKKLQGKPIRLRIVLNDADLYSFVFEKAEKCN